MTEVVAVLDHEGRQRRLARALAAAFRDRGLDLSLRYHRDLVAEVSIEQSPGLAPSVQPDRVLLWLSPADPRGELPPLPDERFLAAEILSAARSIAMLTRSPVLNRPTAVSSCGRLPAGAVAATLAAARIPGLAEWVRPESFTAGAGDRGESDGDEEVYDYATGLSSYGRRPDAAGPLRRRPSVPASRPASVRVVGGRALAPAAVPPAAVAASRRISDWYGLDLATVWWLVAGDGPVALARIDCWIWDRAASGDLDETAAAIAEWACAQRSDPPVRAAVR